jgi:hypothetical protein
MTQAAFKPRAYLKVGCPFSFKFLLFASEARLLDSIEIVRCDPEHPEFERIKSKLEQATHDKASFPTVEVEPGVYKSDSDELIEYFARRYSVAEQKLPVLAFYKDSIFPQLLECHE